MAERKAWWEILRDQFASRGLLDPESERVQETVRALPAVKRQVRGLLSLAPQAESDTALEMGLGVMPGVGQAMALRDLERARRAKDPGAAAMAASNFVPFGTLLNRFRRGPMSELDVYHGTPHKYAPTEANPLGEFDASKIGTGEGAQAYGHGIYLAERENVARDYAHSLSQRLPDRIKLDSVPVKGDDFFSRSLEDMALLGKQSALQKLDDNIRFNEKYAPEMAALYRSTREQIEKIDPASVSLNRGNLLKADLPDEMIDRMLDWDKPLSEQPYIAQALGIPLRDIEAEIALIKKAQQIGVDPTSLPEYQKLEQLLDASREYRDMTGAGWYERMGDKVKASEALRAAGIPGIKYLDAGSRGQGGSGTRNFVVFPGEEKKVKILERK